jgi:hypothetical protein
MTRREFLTKSGTAITAAVLASVLGGTGKGPADTRSSSGRTDSGKMPDPDMFTRPVMKAIAL